MAANTSGTTSQSKLHAQRGQDNGVVIRYGKNLTDLEQDRNISNVATGIYPYWTDMDGNLVTCNPKVIPAPGTYNFTRVNTGGLFAGL